MEESRPDRGTRTHSSGAVALTAEPFPEPVRLLKKSGLASEWAQWLERSPGPKRADGPRVRVDFFPPLLVCCKTSSEVLLTGAVGREGKVGYVTGNKARPMTQDGTVKKIS